jgi:chromosome segregation ATPase
MEVLIMDMEKINELIKAAIGEVLASKDGGATQAKVQELFAEAKTKIDELTDVVTSCQGVIKEKEEEIASKTTALDESEKTVSEKVCVVENLEASLATRDEEIALSISEKEALAATIKDLEEKYLEVSNKLVMKEKEDRLRVRMEQLASENVLLHSVEDEQKTKIFDMSDEDFASYKGSLVVIRNEFAKQSTVDDRCSSF